MIFSIKYGVIISDGRKSDSESCCIDYFVVPRQESC